MTTEADNARVKAWLLAHPERRKEIQARYRAKNAAKIKAYQSTPEFRARHRAAYARDPAKFCEKSKAVRATGYYARYWREYAKKNAGKINLYMSQRRKYHRQATPAWADLDAIKDIYIEAEYQQMHVDHIIPLKGKTVCGLHVEYNLQLLTPTANRKKQNKLLPEYMS